MQSNNLSGVSGVSGVSILGSEELGRPGYSPPARTASAYLRTNAPVGHFNLGGHSFNIRGDSRLAKARRFAAHVLSSQKFDAAIGLVIVGNSVTIGFDITWRQSTPDAPTQPLIDLLEQVFLSVYIVELALRFFAQGVHCLADNWVKFDLLLVVIGVATTWMLTAFSGFLGQGDPSPVGGDTGDEGSLGILMVFRMGRLFRLARTLRLLIKFRDLWILVRGLLDSASTMFYTLILLIIMLYIFACIGVEIIGMHSLASGPEPDPVFKAIVDDYFSSVQVTMLTLVQFVCLDGVSGIYKPLIERDMFLAPYLLGCILVIGIVLMNLITAVIVNGALERAGEDREVIRAGAQAKKKKLIWNLRKMFKRLDCDNSGQVTLDEIANLTDDDKAMLYNALTITDPSEVFAALDVNGGGSLDIDEFCDGIWQLAISNAPIEIKRIEKQVLAIREDLVASKEERDRICQTLRHISDLIDPGSANRGSSLSSASWASAASAEPLLAEAPPAPSSPPVRLFASSRPELKACKVVDAPCSPLAAEAKLRNATPAGPSAETFASDLERSEAVLLEALARLQRARDSSQAAARLAEPCHLLAGKLAMPWGPRAAGQGLTAATASTTTTLWPLPADDDRLSPDLASMQSPRRPARLFKEDSSAPWPSLDAGCVNESNAKAKLQHLQL